jgi:hypothetical protein
MLHDVATCDLRLPVALLAAMDDNTRAATHDLLKANGYKLTANG